MLAFIFLNRTAHLFRLYNNIIIQGVTKVYRNKLCHPTLPEGAKYVAITTTSICDGRRLLELQVFDCFDVTPAKHTGSYIHTHTHIICIHHINGDCLTSHGVKLNPNHNTLSNPNSLTSHHAELSGN